MFTIMQGAHSQRCEYAVHETIKNRSRHWVLTTCDCS